MTAVLGLPLARSASGQAEPLVRLELIQSPNLVALPGAGPGTPLPWWRSNGGHGMVAAEGGIAVGPKDWLEQPIAFPVESASRLELFVRVIGAGRLILRDGSGKEASWDIGSPEMEASTRLTSAQLMEAFGGSPVPRMVVRLEGRGPQPARWLEVRAEVAMPAVSASALRTEIVNELEWVIRLYREQAADKEGPVHTAFAAHYFDVLNGRKLFPLPGWHTAIADLYLVGARHGVPGAAEANAAFIGDLLELGFDPQTALPWRWNCTTDKPQADGPLEPHRCLGYLVDVAENGAPGLDEELRTKAHGIARRLAATCMKTGVLPDGQFSAMYIPRTGRPVTQYPAIRRMDMPAQVARIARFEGLEEPPIAVVDAVAQLLYSHTWVGDWRNIDPGFDDNYGHYGGRGVVLWQAYPDVEVFRELAMGGWRYYSPRWRDAMRFGGNIAADQVRCWKVFAEIAELDPTIIEALVPLLRDALLVHWKGGQYDGGAWGDVTIENFDPKPQLQVGDTKGVPQNLLAGMAVLYDNGFAQGAGGMSLAEQRARIWAILESTRASYRRSFGYLSTRKEVNGDNLCGGEVRMAAGLSLLLEAIDEAHPELWKAK